MTLTETETIDAAILESVMLRGDLRQLNSVQKLSYYNAVCNSIGLNPLTQPFAYITLNGKEVLYAKREATEQLRKVYNISIDIKARELIDGVYVVTATATMPSGRHDESTGAVAIDALKGEPKANGMLKAETKAKRRVTLSICGLGMLDETEVESIPSARPMVTESVTLVPVEHPAEAKKTEAPEAIPEDESPYISQHQRSMISKRFRESVKPELEVDAHILRHAALEALHRTGQFKSKLVNDQGNPSPDFILKDEYKAIGEALVKAAKSL